MRHQNPIDRSFVEYNDNDMEHVLAGPEYGQPWRGYRQVWEEIESDQFLEWVADIQNSILNHQRILI